jgi:hypothetical protein
MLCCKPACNILFEDIAGAGSKQMPVLEFFVYYVI